MRLREAPIARHLIVFRLGCQLEFAASEIRRFLDSKAFDLLEKIKAERAVTDACLEGEVHSKVA